MNSIPFWGTALILVCLLAAAGAFVTVRAQSRLQASLAAATPPPAPGVGPAGATVVSTIAGELPSPEYVDGPAAVAIFRSPEDLVVDAQGNVYVADGSVVRKITPAGLVSTLAGEAPDRMVMQQGSLTHVRRAYLDPCDGRGSTARFSHLSGIAIGPDGTLFVSDVYTIRRISPQGDVTTLAGQHRVEGHADGLGAEASFHHPLGLAVDGQGNVYVADDANHTIRKITPAGLVSTYAGRAGEDGHADGPRTQARFDRPNSLAFAPDGALFVHDRSNRTFRRISPQGEVSTWGGHPDNVARGTGPGAALTFDYHQGLAIDQAGYLYTIRYSNAIRRIRLRDGAEQPYAGNPDEQGQIDAATPADARFNFPAAVAIGPDGSVYVADHGNRVVRKISPQGAVSTLAGRNPDVRFNNPADRKRLSLPSGVAFDAQGTLYVADQGNSLVRRVSPAGAISTWAGRQGQRNFADGAGVEAVFGGPADVAVGPDGCVYVADAGNHTLRKISPQGVVSTLAGQPLEAGDRNGLGRKAQLAAPNTVAVAPNGTVYLTDGETGAVRRITPAGQVSTFRKGWRQGFIGPLSNAPNRVAQSSAVAVGPDGAVYVFQGALYKCSASGRARLLAGDPAAEWGFADGTGRRARFNRPGALAVDARGNVYVADTGNHLIRRVSPAGEVTTIAGDVHYENTDRGYGPESGQIYHEDFFGDYRDGPGAQARFNHPVGLTVGPDGALYVADSGNECIRVIREVK